MVPLPEKPVKDIVCTVEAVRTEKWPHINERITFWALTGVCSDTTLIVLPEVFSITNPIFTRAVAGP
jgi:hypothetical protein